MPRDTTPPDGLDATPEVKAWLLRRTDFTDEERQMLLRHFLRLRTPAHEREVVRLLSYQKVSAGRCTVLLKACQLLGSNHDGPLMEARREKVREALDLPSWPWPMPYREVA